MAHQDQNIGRFRIKDELGRGSMGIVHLGEDPSVGRDVAIKTILLPHGLTPGQKEEFHDRFRHEARAAGRLSHPGIVTVYEYNDGGDDKLPFIAMEYVAGPTLDELIARGGPIDPSTALSMVDKLADALQSAHDQGVVHRDLKPANILVRESDGSAKIVDFGVARISLSRLTDVGTTHGSPAYMAPERIRGRRADGRSDLFSLATILFEALTGVRPFDGEDYASIVHAIVHEETPSIRKFNPTLSPAFDEFFAIALAKNPDERFQDGTHFGQALRELNRSQESWRGAGATMAIPLPADVQAEGVTLTSRLRRYLPEWPAVVNLLRGLLQVVRNQPRNRLLIGAIPVVLLIGLLAGWGLRDTPEAGKSTPGANLGGEAPAGSAVPVAAHSEPSLPPAANLGGESPSGSAVPVAAHSEPSLPPAAEGGTASGPNDGVSSGRPAEPAVEVSADPPPSAPARPVAKANPRRPPTPAPVPKTKPATSPPVLEPATVSPEGNPAAEAAPTAAGVDSVQLGLMIKSAIKRGTLTLLIDGETVYTTGLESDSGRWARAYRKVTRRADQQLDAELDLSAGMHTIEAQVSNTARSKDYESRLEIDLRPDDPRTLTVVIGATFGRRLSLKFE